MESIVASAPGGLCSVDRLRSLRPVLLSKVSIFRSQSSSIFLAQCKRAPSACRRKESDFLNASAECERLQNCSEQEAWKNLGRMALLFLGSTALFFVGGLQLCRPARAEPEAAAPATAAEEKVMPVNTGDKEIDEMFAQLGQLQDLMSKGDVASGIELLSKLIETYPNQLEFRFIRAQAYEFVGDLTKAREEYEELLRLEPMSIPALQGLAIISKKDGKQEISEIEKMVEEGASKADSPQDHRNYRMLLGQLFTLQEDLPKALNLYADLVKEDPSDYRPHLCQGLVSCMLGNLKDAEEHFKNYDQHCPKDAAKQKFLNELISKARAEAQKEVEATSSASSSSSSSP